MQKIAWALFIAIQIVTALPVRSQIINTLRGFDEQELGWSGGAEGTIAIADGNTDYFEFELSAVAQHMSERNRWRLIGRFMRRTASDVEIGRNQLGHLRHNYRIETWLATVALLQTQHDPFRRIETRNLAGLGARFDVIRSESWKGALGGTYMYEDEELTDDDAGFVTDHRFSFFLSLYSASTERVQTDISAFYQPRIDDLSDARAFASASVRVDIVGSLYLLLRYNLLHDSNPPAGVEETDQSVRSGLGFEF